VIIRGVSLVYIAAHRISFRSFESLIDPLRFHLPRKRGMTTESWWKKMLGSIQMPGRRSLGLPGAGWPPATTMSWVAASFCIALALAVIVLAIFGAGGRGTALALKVTAAWAFLLFWLAYAGSAAAALFGPRFAGWARRGREFGLGFAAALAVHVGLVVWHYRIATEPVGVMAFFWAGVACTGLLALFSLPQLRAALGPHLWRIFCAGALEYIALVFAADLILIPLRVGGVDKYPPSYLPFAAMLIAGTGLRLAAFARRMMAARNAGLPKAV
jgi:hypothetical protein